MARRANTATRVPRSVSGPDQTAVAVDARPGPGICVMRCRCAGFAKIGTVRVQIVAVHDLANGVGESPLWDGDTVRWVDITGRTVHGLGPDGALVSHAMPDFPCFIALRRRAGPSSGCDGSWRTWIWEVVN